VDGVVVEPVEVVVYQAVGALVWATMAVAMDRDSAMLEVLDGVGPADEESLK
jgi:hypothetical protein